MNRPFDLEDHYGLRVKYVPARGDADPVFVGLIEAAAGGRQSWTNREWCSLIYEIENSELTLGEYIEFKQSQKGEDK